MKNNIKKKLGMGIVSLSAVALLAACGDTNTTEDPAVEDPAVEEPATDPATDDTTDDATTDDATDDTTDDTTADTTQTTDAPDTSNGIYGVEFAVSLEEAVQIFHDTFGEGINISDVDFDTDRGTYEYQISGWDEENDYELDIDATTGEVNEEETDRDSDRDNVIDFNAIISPTEAMDIAVEESGSDFVEDWSLEEDDGFTIYEVNIENGNDVTIDAETGDVLPED